MRTRRNYRKRNTTKKRRGGLFGTLFTSPETKARVAKEQAAAVAAAKARGIQKARDKAQTKKFWLDVFFIITLLVAIFLLIGTTISLLVGA